MIWGWLVLGHKGVRIADAMGPVNVRPRNDFGSAVHHYRYLGVRQYFLRDAAHD